VVPLTKGGWEGDVDGPHVLGNVGLERRAGGEADGAREGHEQLDGEDAENLPDETLPNLDKKKKKRRREKEKKNNKVKEGGERGRGSVSRKAKHVVANTRVRPSVPASP